MWQLNQTKELWDHWPIILFSSFWISFLLLLSLKWQATFKKWRWILLSTSSGIFLSIGFPPLPLTPIMFIAFVPLLMMESEIAGEQKSVRKIWFYSYNTFVVWNILTTFWVANTAFVAGIVAIWLNSFFMTWPIIAFHLSKKYIPRLAGLAFIVFWISFEILHLNWELTWPWLNLGNAFAQFPSWIQWYEYTGTLGGTLWILAVNLLIFNLLQKRKTENWNGGMVEYWKIGGLLMVPIIISMLIYFTYEDKGKANEVVVVQPNFEPHYEKFNTPEKIQLNRFIELAEEKITDKTEYLVFPETSFGLVEISNFKIYPEIRKLREFLKKYPKLKIVTGVNSYKRFKKGEPETPFMRESYRKNGDTVRWELYNGAIQITADDSEEIQHYKKSKLVPGAEFLPYRNLFFFFEPLVKKLGGSLSGHGMQEERTNLNSPTGKVAPVICYESVYGDYHTGYIKNGAEAVFIMTNDGWWDKTAGHRQHLKFASLRAIETRKSIARSANTGISAFLNQRGDILQPTKYDEPIAIRSEILFNDEKTFYVKWGDFIGRLSVLTALLLILNVLVKIWKSRTEEM